jgi:hypothetical protein
MGRKSLAVFVAAIALTATSASIASEHRKHERWDDVAPSVVLVRAHKLIGMDDQQRERVLFEDADGVLVPLTDLRGLIARLNADLGQIAMGSYDALKLKVANEAHVYGTSGRPVVTRLRNEGEPDVLHLPGSFRVTARGVQHVWPESAEAWPYASRGYRNKHKDRYARQGKGHDDD